MDWNTWMWSIKPAENLYRVVQLIALFVLFGSFARAEHEVKFSIERGLFDAPFQVELSTDDANAQIRYTTDLSKPNASDQLYTGPISVSSFTAIRAIAISATNTSKAVTHSYIFPSQVWNQPDMGGHVVTNSQYASRLLPSLLAIPSISIVDSAITPDEFIDTVTEISAEMMFPDGRTGWMEQVGGKSWGGSPTNPKRQYRLEFKAAIGGSGKLRFPGLFDDGVTNAIPAATSFDHLLLRSGSQDGLNAEFGDEPYATFIRNRVCFDMEMAMGNPAPHGRFVHVYVNGEYRGQYHLMERPNAGWMEEYFEGDKADFDVRKSGEYLDGTSTFYDQMFSVVDSNVNNGESGYNNIQNYLHTERLAEYLVLGAYLGTADGNADHNSLCGANRTPGRGGYQFMLWDKDPSLANPMAMNSSYSPSIKWYAAPDSIDDSSEFTFQMGDATHTALIHEQAPLEVQRARDLWHQRANQVRLSLVAESARWGNVVFENKYNTDAADWNVDDHWEAEIARVDEWMGAQATSVIGFMEEKGYLTSLEGVSYSVPFGSLVPQGAQVQLTNLEGAGTVYYARNADPRKYGNDFSGQQVQGSNITLTGGAVDILARVRLNGAWSAATPQRYYLEQNWQDVVVNEIHYNPTLACGGTEADELDFIELHNRGNTLVDLSDCAFDDGIHYRFPFGTSIPAGGFLVLAENADAFQSVHGFSPDGTYAGGLDNGGETLRLVNPVGGLISTTTYNDKGDWPRDPDGGGPSLERLDPSASSDNPMNWFASAQPCGTPRAPNSVFCPAANLVINEIMYKPEGNKPGSLDAGEWIEIYNPGSSVVNLSGWSFLHNGVYYPFPNGSSIGPGAYTVAVSNATTFIAAHPGGGFFYQIDGLRLDNGGGRLELRSASNCPADVLRYGDSAPWPSGPDGPGPSLSLLAPNLDNSLPASWAASGNLGGTPGAPNYPSGTSPCANPPADIVISEINYNGPGNDWFELYNAGNTSINLGGWAIATEARVTSLPSATIAAGGTKVFCRNAVSFDGAYPGVSRTVLSNFLLSNSGDRLLLLSPGRCEADYVKFADSLPWPGTADGSGDTITLLDPATDNELAWNWSGETPSPGQVVLQPPCPAAPAIVINEINVDSSPFADVGDWIELYNNSGKAVNLGGWKFYDQSGAFAFPNFTFIGAGEYLVVAEDIFAFQAEFPAAPNVINGAGFTLSGGGEPIALLDGNCVVDALVYDNQAPWPTFGLGAGSSLSLLDVSLDNADGANWFTPNEGLGTPGATNTEFTCFDPVPAIIIDDYAGNGPAGDWLRIRNTSGNTVDLEGYQLADRAEVMFLSNLVLSANQTMVFADEPNNFAAANPGVIFLPLAFNINASNEVLTLFNRTHCIVDQVTTAAGDLNHVPQLFGPFRRTANETGAFSFLLSTVDPDAGQSLTFALEPGAPAGLSLNASSGRITWNPGEADGPGVFDVVVVVSDNGSPQGRVTQRLELIVNEVNQAPTFTLPSQLSLPELSTWNFNVNARDADLPAQTLTTTLVSGPPGLTLNNGLLQWTPTEAQGPGSYTVTIEVGDGSTTVSKSATLNVTEVNDPPVFANAVLNRQTAERDLWLWQVVAQDNDSATPIYSINAAAPAGMVMDPISGHLRWIPQESDGGSTVSFVVTATDSAGASADQTINLTVAERPDAPVGLSCTNLETLVSKGSVWAWSQAESGNAWKEPWVDVAAWSVGPAKFGWGEADDVTSIPANSTRTVFVQSFTAASVASLQGLTLNLRRDDGAIVFLNGEEIVRDNLPAGSVNENTLAMSSVFGTAEREYEPFSIDLAKLAEGTNVLSVAVHQVAQNSNDMSFDAELVAGRLASCTPLVLDVELYKATGLLGWDTDPGRVYSIEYCDDLRVGTWNTVTNITATASRIEMPDPTGAPVMRRCYRIRMQ